MKVIIDRDKCHGHSHFASIAPNVLELDAYSKSFMDSSGDDGELVLKAATACPKLAILIEDGPSGTRIFPEPMTSRAISSIPRRNRI